VSGARDAILSAIRSSGGAGVPDAQATVSLRAALPERATGDAAALTQRFVDMALFAGATVGRVRSADDAPAEIAGYLSRNELGGAVALSPDPAVAGLAWDRAPRLTLLHTASRAQMAGAAASVTAALAGVAETGTLVIGSGGAVANALHLLPEAHIAVLRAADIVGGYEAGLARIGNAPPRAVTLVTGPSRTADIEKTPQIGVHGPRRLHIVLVDG
jgi:L-lactate dehydrogenase complex protein LldG